MSKAKYCAYDDCNVLVSSHINTYRGLIWFSALFTCGISLIALLFVKEKCPICGNTELLPAFAHKKSTQYTNSNINIK